MELTQATAQTEEAQCTRGIPTWSGLMIFDELGADELR